MSNDVHEREAVRHEAADYLVRGRLVTMNETRNVIADGGIAVHDGRIVDIGTWPSIRERWRSEAILGNSRAIVMPGMIDAHTHCTQCFVRSLTAGELPMIPRIYNPAVRALNEEQANSAARLLAAQLIGAGITTLCEGTLNPDHEAAILEAFESVGIRCCFARGAADQDFHHVALYAQTHDKSWVRRRENEAEKDLRRTEAYLDKYPCQGDGLIRAAVNVSALLGFSEAYFQQGAELARRRKTSLHVHVSRDREEVELSLSVWGCRPVERLAEMGVIDEHLVVAHAVLANEKEIGLLGRGKASLVHSPIESVSNLNAVPNIQQFREAGVRVAFGCDNQANDMFANLRVAWMVQTALWGLPRYDPAYLCADELLAMATIDAAAILRWDDLIGSLEAGKAADLIVLDGDSPHLMALQDLPTDLVRYATRGEIRQTMVAGRLIYDAGAYPTVDIERLSRESDAGANHVRSMVRERRYQTLPHLPAAQSR